MRRVPRVPIQEMGESHSRCRDQGLMIMESKLVAAEDGVAHHYARSGLIEAIESGLVQMGKTKDTVGIDDLSAVDEFHIGGRKATEQLMAQLKMSAGDHVLDVGSGLGGPARF